MTQLNKNKQNQYYINELNSIPDRIKNVLGEDFQIDLNKKKVGHVVRFSNKGSIVAFRNYLSFEINPYEMLTFCFKFNNHSDDKNYVVIGKTTSLSTLEFPPRENQSSHVTCFSGQVNMTSVFKFFSNVIELLNYGDLTKEQLVSRLVEFYENHVILTDENSEKLKDLHNTKTVLVGKVKLGDYRSREDFINLLITEQDPKKYSLESFDIEIEKDVQADPRKQEENALEKLIKEKEEELKLLKISYEAIYKSIRQDATKPYKDKIKKLKGSLKDNYENRQKIYKLINSIEILIRNKNFNFRSKGWLRMIDEIENEIGLERFNLVLKALKK